MDEPSSNFDGSPMAAPLGRAVPQMTPPTIRPPDRTVIGAEELPLGKRAAIAAPQYAIPDFSEQDSVFVPRISPPVFRNYAPPASRPTDYYPLAPAEQLEVILLATGKEFTGRVLERGALFRVQLTNGSIITLNGARVAATRPVASAPVEPQPLDY